MKNLLFISAVALSLALSAGAQTFFYFTSSPSSFVGGGQTLYATPADGFTIGVSDTWRVQAWCYGPGFNPNWQVLFQAANGAAVTVGQYNDTRELADSIHPSLYFFGQGRASSGPTGYFNVLDLTQDASGTVLSFAADFMQYDHGDPAAWNAGSIRFNSAIPIPEPHLFGAASFFYCIWIFKRRFAAAVPVVK